MRSSHAARSSRRRKCLSVHTVLSSRSHCRSGRSASAARRNTEGCAGISTAADGRLASGTAARSITLGECAYDQNDNNETATAHPTSFMPVKPRYYHDEKEAALAYDAAARTHHAERAVTNFDTKGERVHGVKRKKARRLSDVPQRDSSTSQYRGVSWVKQDRRWRASISHSGKNRSLGYFGASRHPFDCSFLFGRSQRSPAFTRAGGGQKRESWC